MSTKRKFTPDTDDINSIEANFLSNVPTTVVKSRTNAKGINSHERQKNSPQQRTKTTSNRTSSRKRQLKVRKETKSSDSAPVPDPPSSLVKLLRKDKKVLDYFTALQRNLDRDVQKWKDKALEYKSKLRKSTRDNISRGKDGVDVDDVHRNHQVPLQTIHVSAYDPDGDDGSSLEINVDNHSFDKDGNCTDAEMENRKMGGDDNGDNNVNRDKHLAMQKSMDRKSRVEGGSNDHNHNKTSGIKSNKTQCLKNIHSSPENKENNSKSKQNKVESDKNGMEEISFTDEIANELLATSSSSSSSSSSSHKSPATMMHSHIESKEAQRREGRREIIAYLIEAYENLLRLGVWFVDVNVPKEVVHQPRPTLEVQETEIVHKANSGNDDDCLNHGGSSSSSEDGDIFCFHKDLEKSKKNGAYSIENDTASKGFKENALCSYTRRSDVEVIADLMRAIRSFIRLPASVLKNVDSHVGERLQPFLGSDLIPCCYADTNPHNSSEDKAPSYDSADAALSNDLSLIDELPHPAMSGFLLVCRSLVVIDTYASPNSPFTMEGEWEKLFDDALNTNSIDENDGSLFQKREKLEQIYIGIQSRNITSMLLQSLDSEITRYWAFADRAIRETTTVLINEKTDASDHDDSSDCNGEIDTLSHDNDLAPNPSIEFFNPKSLNRLFTLAERICHARLVSFLLQYRSDIQEAGRLVIEYILSTCPSPTIEDYNKYPPIMSCLILEALLSRIVDEVFLGNDTDDGTRSPSFSWFFLFLQNIAEIPSSELTDDDLNQPLLSVALMLNVHTAANIWQERLRSKDKRIRDISRVEIAAYRRLLQSESGWLQSKSKESAMSNVGDSTATNSLEVVEKARSFLLPNQSEGNSTSLPMPLNIINAKAINACLSIQSSLLLMGDHTLALSICKDALNRYDKGYSRKNIYHHILPPVIVTCFKAYTVLKCRKWESYRLTALETKDIGAEELILGEESQDFNITCEVDKMIEMLDGEHKMNNDENRSQNVRKVPTSTMLRCCLILSDAIRANSITKASLRNPSKSRVEHADELQMILDIGEYPCVRVINLNCRPDRWNNFMIQAQREQLLVARAVATLREKGADILVDDDSFYWGLYAYDGTNIGQLAFEKKMHPNLGSNQLITDLVAMRWSPKELKRFDSHARDDVEQVMMTPSERACALSHVSSWIGVKRSLHCKVEDDNNANPSQNRRDRHLLRMLKISGFARGDPILLENTNFPPSPVCVILEDDSVLVDRFSDRLALLLDELPRDFHFCSLGYGRPKNAPIIRYLNASQIGVPTCIWYLTGYIVSLAGVNHLLDSLPVKGPVDSWIGLKMMSNWNNSYGNRIGVAKNTKVYHDTLPDKKALKSIMKFRCFAALVPLCSQKVGASTSTATTDKNKWRQRDTDITYSGHNA